MCVCGGGGGGTQIGQPLPWPFVVQVVADFTMQQTVRSRHYVCVVVGRGGGGLPYAQVKYVSLLRP